MIDKPKDSTNKLLDLGNDVSKFLWLKINLEKLT